MKNCILFIWWDIDLVKKKVWRLVLKKNMVLVFKKNMVLLPSPLKEIPWNLSFRYILFHEKRLQKMLLYHNARVNSHPRWKQTRFRRLLSSLVWIDQYNEWNGMTSFMEFMRHTSRSQAEFPEKRMSKACSETTLID